MPENPSGDARQKTESSRTDAEPGIIQASSPGVSARMARVRNRDTAAEIAIRKHLHRMGYRYRVNLKLPGFGRVRPDVVFSKRRIAVFVDGCFWHRCPEHATFPKANQEWWAKKLETNEQRDRATDETLSSAGWKVIRVWEHEDSLVAARMIAEEVDRSTRGTCHT